jgi:uncharacterized repeat protein (TIGR04076 family)
MSKVRITVVERTFNEEISRDYGSEGFLAGRGFGPCPNFQEGQEFILDGLSKPQRFCSWAWADIHREVRTVAFGGGFPWVNTPDSAIACCTDGMKPVVFKIERIDGHDADGHHVPED